MWKYESTDTNQQRQNNSAVTVFETRSAEELRLRRKQNGELLLQNQMQGAAGAGGAQQKGSGGGSGAKKEQQHGRDDAHNFSATTRAGDDDDEGSPLSSAVEGFRPGEGGPAVGGAAAHQQTRTEADGAKTITTQHGAWCEKRIFQKPGAESGAEKAPAEAAGPAKEPQPPAGGGLLTTRVVSLERYIKQCFCACFCGYRSVSVALKMQWVTKHPEAGFRLQSPMSRNSSSSSPRALY